MQSVNIAELKSRPAAHRPPRRRMAGLLLRLLRGLRLLVFAPRVPLRSTLGYDPVLTGDMVNKTYRGHGEQLFRET